MLQEWEGGVERLIAWLKTLVGAVCILTILLHLIPEGKFAKYVRFYAGLLFFLMAVSPLLDFLTGEGELERLLQLEFLKEDYYNLETAVEGMGELKNDAILAAYQIEIRRQIQTVAEAYGANAGAVEVAFDPADEYQIRAVSIELMNDTEAGEADAGKELSAAAGQIREELASVYGLMPGRISITGLGGRRL